jgi:hypothetical protein
MHQVDGNPILSLQNKALKNQDSLSVKISR